MITVYGIKNCDTVKKARRWLEANGVVFQFHDFRSDGLDEETVNIWLKAVTWDTLLNRKSTTWRQLDETQRDNIDAKNAVQLMLSSPTIIKRPVLVKDDVVLVGFDEIHYKTLL